MILSVTLSKRATFRGGNSECAFLCVTDKILLDDLLEYDAYAEEDLPDVVHYDRNRRSAEETTPEKCKKGGSRHNRCCNDGFEHTQEMKDLKRQCFAEVKKGRKAKHHGFDGDFDVFSCEKVEKAKEKVICAMECLARKQQLVSKCIARVNSLIHLFFPTGG